MDIQFERWWADHEIHKGCDPLLLQAYTMIARSAFRAGQQDERHALRAQLIETQDMVTKLVSRELTLRAQVEGLVVACRAYSEAERLVDESEAEFAMRMSSLWKQVEVKLKADGGG